MRLDSIRLIWYVSWLLAWLLVQRLSVRWLTRKQRELLAKALGRSVRPGEEDSLKTWLQLPASQLDEVAEQLAKNPFDEIAGRLDRGLEGSSQPDDNSISGNAANARPADAAASDASGS